MRPDDRQNVFMEQDFKNLHRWSPIVFAWDLFKG